MTTSKHITPLFITAYGPKIKTPITFHDEGLTKQSFKDECDINTIMGRYAKTGVLPPEFNQRTPQYLDVTGDDFQSAMELVGAANSMFAEMPSALRERFENDPAKFLAFTSDEKNLPEMAAMGLLNDDAATRILTPPAPEKPAPAPPEAPKL